MEPGPVLAAFLSSIDVSRLSGFDRIVVLRARQRLVSHYQAQLYGDMAAISDAIEDLDGPDDPEAVWHGAAAEIRAALRLTRRAADSELGVALDLRERLPRLYKAFEAGLIDVRRAQSMLRSTAHLDQEATRQVVDQILQRAPQLTTGQLKAALARLAIEVAPDEAQTRYETAVEERRILSELSEDGTAHLSGFDLPPDRVAAVSAHINRIAKSLRRDGEERTMDQLRADIFLDLLEGHHRGRKTAAGGVEIRVDLATLARLSEAPGELAGYGPVIADIARPHRTLEPNPHHPNQPPRPRMPPRPQSRPPPPRLDLPTTTRRRLALDQPTRTPIHHQRQTTMN